MIISVKFIHLTKLNPKCPTVSAKDLTSKYSGTVTEPFKYFFIYTQMCITLKSAIINGKKYDVIL